MNKQQKRFVDDYLIHFNATKAAIKAGYKASSARQQACNILALDEVSDYIEKKQQAISKQAEIDAAWVLSRFKFISDACVKAEPVMRYDAESKEYVSVTDDNGQPVYEFDSGGANKATEMIGKMIGAFESDNKQKAAVVNNNIGNKRIIEDYSGDKPLEEPGDGF